MPILVTIQSVPSHVSQLVLRDTVEWKEWKQQDILHEVVINFATFTTLKYLDMDDCKLVYFPSLPDSLLGLSCQCNLFPVIQSLPQSLISFNCSFCNILVFPELPSSLRLLDCMQCGITELPELPHNLLCLNFSNIATRKGYFLNRISSLPPKLPSSLIVINGSQNVDLNFPIESIQNVFFFICDGCPLLEVAHKNHPDRGRLQSGFNMMNLAKEFGDKNLLSKRNQINNIKFVMHAIHCTAIEKAAQMTFSTPPTQADSNSSSDNEDTVNKPSMITMKEDNNSPSLLSYFIFQKNFTLRSKALCKWRNMFGVGNKPSIFTCKKIVEAIHALDEHNAVRHPVPTP